MVGSATFTVMAFPQEATLSLIVFPHRFSPLFALAHSFVSVLFACFVPLPRAAMGMLNNGAAVLTSGSNPDSGFGWKFLALIEVGMAMLFVFKFWKVRCRLAIMLFSEVAL